MNNLSINRRLDMKKFHLASDDMKRKMRKALLIGIGLVALGGSANAQGGGLGKVLDKVITYVDKKNDTFSARYDQVGAVVQQGQRVAYNAKQLDNLTGGFVSRAANKLINNIAAKKARNEPAKMELQNMTYDRQETPTRQVAEQSYQQVETRQQERRVVQENPQVETRQQVRVQETKSEVSPKKGTVREISLDELVKMAKERDSKRK